MSQTQSMTKLDFREQLLPSGKRDTTDALLKRLKTLHEKLAALEQDYTDVRSLDPVRKPLISSTILHHKDRGVKAYAACCLADLLRLYAPDAPYQPNQLRDIFQFISAQINLNLKPPAAPVKPLQPSRTKTNDATPTPSQTQLSQRVTDVPYYTEYFALLDNLATIKSVVLICDVPNGDELITGFFVSFMEIARPDMNKSVMRHLRDILVAIVEEAATIPEGVMDCLVEQFQTYASKPETPSFQLTVEVCNQVADKLKRQVFAHFSAIQLEHGRDPSAEDLKILTESHELLLTINRFCPNLLLNVVPLLEENLRAADEIPLRQLTVKTLGTIFGQRAGVEDPAKKYPSTWRAWVGRRLDKALQVRLAWVEGTRGVLINHPEIRGQLEEALIERLHDSDERVRAAVCKVVGTLDYESALHHLDVKLLRAVAGRLSDKKAATRTEALNALSKLWNLAFSEIEANDPEAVAQFAWIPESMLHCFYMKDANPEMRVQVTVTFKKTILPLPQDVEDEQAWVDRLLLVASHLDEPALKALDKLSNLTGFSKGSSPYAAFVSLCETNNGGVIGADAEAQNAKERLNFVIDAIARQLGDYEKARKDLHTFADANDPRLYKLFKATVDIHSNLATIVKSRHELHRRIHQSHTDIEDTITSLVEMAAWNIINHSAIPPLVKRLQRPDSEIFASSAAHFLSLIAKEGAPMYKTHVPGLIILMSDKKNEKLVEVALQALAAVVKVHPETAPSEKRVLERATNAVLEGTPRQAKFAARFIARYKEASSSKNLIDRILKEIKKEDNSKQLSYLCAFSELALSATKDFQDQSDAIIKYVMDDVMLAKSPSYEVEGDEWVEEDTLEPLDRAKLLGLRVCTHWALGFAREPDNIKLIQPTLDLLTSVLVHDGMVNENTLEGGNARCHMRLRASLCLLKLANVRAYDKAITQPTQFELVGGTIQDPCYMVRHLFLKKLGEVIPSQRLLPRWNLIPALVAMDPDQDNINLARTVFSSIIRTAGFLSQESRIERIELPLARLLHLLTHHPDFDWQIQVRQDGDDADHNGPVQEGIRDMQNLKDISRFIELYLDCVANRENIGLLFAIAGALKTVRDKFADNNKPLYSLSELAQIIIKNRAEKHTWTVPLYPGRIKMPRDIFHHHERPEEQKRVQRTQYLNEETRNWAKGLGKRQIIAPGTSTSKRAEKSDRVDRSSSPVRKRKPKTKSTSRKRVKRDESDDEDDEDEDEDDDEEEEEEEEGEGDEGEEEGSADEVEGAEVLGRGGRRGAKTKAKRAVKRKVKKVKKDKEEIDEQIEVDEESELSELDS